MALELQTFHLTQDSDWYKSVRKTIENNTIRVWVDVNGDSTIYNGFFMDAEYMPSFRREFIF